MVIKYKNFRIYRIYKIFEGKGQLSETDDKPKSKEKRIEEKEKADAETQRSFAIVEMKKAHKQIEEIEKLRKRPVVYSISHRITSFMEYLTILCDSYLKNKQFLLMKVDDYLLDEIKDTSQIYESICFDFQKNFEINDAEMNKLFPKIESNITDVLSMIAYYEKMLGRLLHMARYCERLLI